MKDETITFTKLTEPEFEKIFEVHATDSNIKEVKAFEPEIKNGEIVLPITFTKTDNQTVTLGFALDKTHLRELLDALDYPDTITD